MRSCMVYALDGQHSGVLLAVIRVPLGAEGVHNVSHTWCICMQDSDTSLNVHVGQRGRAWWRQVTDPGHEGVRRRGGYVCLAAAHTHAHAHAHMVSLLLLLLLPACLLALPAEEAVLDACGSQGMVTAAFLQPGDQHASKSASALAAYPICLPLSVTARYLSGQTANFQLHTHAHLVSLPAVPAGASHTP